MPRYKLRTLLILLAIMPPVMAVGWGRYSAWRAERERNRVYREQFRGGSLLHGRLIDNWPDESDYDPATFNRPDLRKQP